MKLQKRLFFLGCAIPTVDNGRPLSSGNLNPGQTVTFTCNTGFELDGAATIMCLTNGSFSPMPPSCVQGKNYFFVF